MISGTFIETPTAVDAEAGFQGLSDSVVGEGGGPPANTMLCWILSLCNLSPNKIMISPALFLFVQGYLDYSRSFVLPGEF